MYKQTRYSRLRWERKPALFCPFRVDLYNLLHGTNEVSNQHLEE